MIHLQDIHFSYGRGKSLFSGLNLDLEAGSICGLLGRNGAGKSTLMKIIAGLLFPRSGQAEVLGYRPGDRNADFLGQLYYISEELHLPDLSLKALRDAYGVFYPNFSNSEFDSYVQSFELDMGQHLKGMSYGQKKKSMVCFGLATNSRLLILDEPTNGLDIPSKSQFRKVLASAITDERCFIISTHQVRDIANLIDPVVILEESEIIYQQSIYDTMNRLYFGTHFGAEEPKEALYSELAPGGYQIVRENRGGEECQVDIEALFNAVLADPKRIQNLFTKEVSHES